MPLTTFHYFKVHLAPTNNLFQISSLPDLKWHQCVDICRVAGLSSPALGGCYTGMLMISAVISAHTLGTACTAQHAPHSMQRSIGQPASMCGRVRAALAPAQVLNAAGLQDQPQRWRDAHQYRPSHNLAPGGWLPIVCLSHEDQQPEILTTRCDVVEPGLQQHAQHKPVRRMSAMPLLAMHEHCPGAALVLVCCPERCAAAGTCTAGGVLFHPGPRRTRSLTFGGCSTQGQSCLGGMKCASTAPSA